VQIGIRDQIGAEPAVIVSPTDQFAPAVTVWIASPTDHLEWSANPDLRALRASRSNQSIRGHLEIAEGPIVRQIDPRFTVIAVALRRTVVLLLACRIAIEIRRGLTASVKLIGLIDIGTFVRHPTDRTDGRNDSWRDRIDIGVGDGHRRAPSLGRISTGSALLLLSDVAFLRKNSARRPDRICLRTSSPSDSSTRC
jgi:hypothetical protein